MRCLTPIHFTFAWGTVPHPEPAVPVGTSGLEWHVNAHPFLVLLLALVVAAVATRPARVDNEEDNERMPTMTPLFVNLITFPLPFLCIVET